MIWHARKLWVVMVCHTGNRGTMVESDRACSIKTNDTSVRNRIVISACNRTAALIRNGNNKSACLINCDIRSEVPINVMSNIDSNVKININMCVRVRVIVRVRSRTKSILRAILGVPFQLRVRVMAMLSSTTKNVDIQY